MLAIMALLAAIVFVWLGVLRPLANWTHEGRDGYRQALADGREIDHRLAEIKIVQARPVARLPKPLDQAVRSVAVQGGFSDVQVEPASNGTVRVSIGAVRSQAFFPWLRDAIRRHGLIVENLNVAPNSDRTLAIVMTLREQGT